MGKSHLITLRILIALGERKHAVAVFFFCLCVAYTFLIYWCRGAFKVNCLQCWFFVRRFYLFAILRCELFLSTVVAGVADVAGVTVHVAIHTETACSQHNST